MHNLRQMMDEIFYPENFIGTFVWKSRHNVDSRNKTGVSIDHEYVLCYGAGMQGQLKDLEKYSNPDNDTRGEWMSDNLVGLASKEKRPNLHYDLIDSETGINYGCPEKGWRYSKTKMNQKMAEGRILWPTKSDGRPRHKKFLAELKSKFTGLSTLLEVGSTSAGTQEIRQIFGTEVFDYPKPVSLISTLIEQCTDDDDIVLDFCAGSGTTGQAVLTLNQEGSDRRFILVQQPYDTKEQEETSINICRSITTERVRRVIDGYAFVGKYTEILFSQKLTLTYLKKVDNVLKTVEQLKKEHRPRFDEIKVKVEDGVLLLEGIRAVNGHTDGLPGTFTFSTVSNEPLLGKYRDLGDALPDYEEIARYVFFTETSSYWNNRDVNSNTGRIGEYKGTAYYLLYTPNGEEDGVLDRGFLKNVAAQEECTKLVVYCEKFWMHRDEMREWEAKHGKMVRHMLMPFNLK